MHKSSAVLSKVREALGMQVALEQRKLENGTLIEAEKFESEEPVFIVTEDEKVALPVGQYKMEDGMTLAVAEEGIISQIIEKIADEVAVEEEVEVEAEAEAREPKKIVESTVKESHFAEEVVEEMPGETEYVTKEELGAAVEEIKAMIDEIKDGKKEEEISQEKAELQAELSKPGASPLRHNPEAKNQQREMVHFASKSKNTVLNRVFNRINN